MLLIVMLHSTYASFGYPVSLSRDTLLIFLFSSISIYGVNIFLLISGYFGVRARKESIKNILFICIFAALFKVILGICMGIYDLRNLLFLSSSNWYIVCYLGLIILSPILNTYIESTTQKNMKILIGLFYFYSLYFSIFPKQADIEPGFNNGCSIAWFIEVYLIGRYFRLYGIPQWINKYSKLILLISIACFFIGQLTLVKVGFGKLLPWWGAQNQPLVLLSAVSFFVTFSKVNIQSKIINHIAQSTVMVLLIHSPQITKHVFYNINSEYNLVAASFLWIMIVILIYSLCTLIDQVRLSIYKKIIKL